MVTIREVAKEAGVSLSTVSRVLNDTAKVDENTKQKVQAAIAALGYRPNLLAKALKEGKTKTIAFVIPNIENRIYPSLAIAVETEARKQGYFVLFCNTQEDSAREQDYIEKLKGTLVDGFLFSTGLTDGKSQTILALQEEGFPAVCLMRSVDTVCSVVSDNYGGGHLGASYLLDQGFTRIAALHGRLDMALYQERIAGYTDALAERGLVPETQLIWATDTTKPNFAFARVTEKLKKGNIPEAIFAMSDPLASEAILAIEQFGLRVPDDISVLGFDNMLFSDHYDLSTMEQPFHEMAKVATQYLISMIEKKETPGGKVFPVKLIHRGSVKERG